MYVDIVGSRCNGPQLSTGHDDDDDDADPYIATGLVKWRRGNALCLINKVALRWAGLLLGRMTVCGQVNHLNM